ncbi:MAG: hypothetical protein H8E83_00245 [Planctomycetes bacterium]|nr:hypothetical protein [Planctomycetota bacterium]
MLEGLGKLIADFLRLGVMTSESKNWLGRAIFFRWLGTSKAHGFFGCVIGVPIILFLVFVAFASFMYILRLIVDGLDYLLDSWEALFVESILLFMY